MKIQKKEKEIYNNNNNSSLCTAPTISVRCCNVLISRVVRIRLTESSSCQVDISEVVIVSRVSCSAATTRSCPSWRRVVQWRLSRLCCWFCCSRRRRLFTGRRLQAVVLFGGVVFLWPVLLLDYFSLCTSVYKTTRHHLQNVIRNWENHSTKKNLYNIDWY